MNIQQNVSFEKETKRINDEVKCKVANHLWMFCGYSDSIYPAISIDAKYIKAISDLYNVIIDSSLITRLGNIAPKKWKYIKDIIALRETINTLRTVGGHTISFENVRQDILLKFKTWEIEQCGTDNPTQKEEFEKLIDGLLKLKSDCLTIVYHFLSDASKVTGKEKEKLIGNWENTIIEYYFRPVNSNMFENKLIEWYQVSQPNGSVTTISNKIALKNAVSNWIMNDIYLKEQKNLDLLLEARRTCYSKLKPNQRILLNQKIQAKEDEIKSIQEKVAKFFEKNIEGLTPADYKKHYLSKAVLREKMRAAIPEIKKQGLTLLPQDLFGYIIEKDKEKTS